MFYQNRKEIIIIIIIDQFQITKYWCESNALKKLVF